MKIIDFHSFIESVACIFFPNRCVFCGKILEPFANVCEECEEILPYIKGETCDGCGLPEKECKCSSDNGRFYEKFAAPLLYAEPVKHGIHRFKFSGERNLGRGYAELMAQTFNDKFSSETFDFVTYVPMNKRDERYRGYNQSRVLARELSRVLDIEFGDRLLVKLYRNDYQRTLNSLQRTGNVFGAFDVDASYDISGKNILLVDDVKTSGSTLSECAKMLYLYGANKVFCLTVAVVNSKID